MKSLCFTASFLFLQFLHAQSPVYETPSLRITPVNERVFVHVTYLQTESFGLVACNGMIYMDDQEAIVFDTPTSDSVSVELIQWIESQGRKVTGVVVNHFHNDCLGGLAAFHVKGIPSYANKTTIEMASEIKPQNGFVKKKLLTIGKLKIENSYFGEAHTRDNIVSYLPDEQVLFGGCMVKAVGASKGFLGDANTAEWSNTVRRILKEYPEVKVVIPGHGASGDNRLLEFTMTLFDHE